MSLSVGRLPSEVGRALTGFHWAFGVAVVLGAAGAAVAAFFIRDSEAAATMVATALTLDRSAGGSSEC